jgi:hypothetical protein
MPFSVPAAAIMRLMNVHALNLEEFFAENIPPYAIFSYTWFDGEVHTKTSRT